MKSQNNSLRWLTRLGRSKKNRSSQARSRRLFQLERLEDRRLLTVGLPELVSINGLGNATASGQSVYTSQSLSGDGRYQVFSSSAPDIVPFDINGANDVFLRDLQTGATTLISRAAGGGTANNSSHHAVISADGSYVAFQSQATNLAVTGTNSTSGSSQIYRWQRSTGQIRLLSPNAAGTDGGNNYSYEASINESGTRIAFRTYADDLVAGIVDLNGSTDVYLRDLSGVPSTILVSRSSVNPLQTGNAGSEAQQISRDGSKVVYRSSAGDLESGVTDLNGTGWDLVSFNIATVSNQYVSVESTAPSSGNAGSSRTDQSLSDDGRYEVFSSDANDLVDGDLNGTTDVFLRDLLTGTTTLISQRAGGGSANSSSHHAVISGDGQYVAFYSHATNLDVTGTNSTNGYSQIYRWQRSSGQIELISVNSSDTDGGIGYSYNPTVSGDGQRIAYQTQASDLIVGLNDVNGGSYDVFLRDLTGVPTTILVSRSSLDPLQTGDNGSDFQQISRDGSRVVYRTGATDSEAGVTDINGTGWDLVTFEISSQTGRYVSVQSTAPSSGNAGSSRTDQSLSDDGRYEVFSSDANDLVDGDLNGTTDVFLRDLLTGTTTLISQRAGGGSANSSSHHAVISGDGQYVAFYSHATNLDVTGTNSTNGYSQIYRWQRSSGQIELISVNSSDTDGGIGYSYNPTVSGDGERIAYQTQASDLIVGLNDVNGSAYDVFLRDLTGVPTTILVSRSSVDPLQTGDYSSDSQQISRDGSRVVYRTGATDSEAGVTDINSTGWDLVTFEVSTQTGRYVSVQSTAPSSGNAGSSRTDQSLSDDGRYEVFSSDANDLVDGDLNSTTDVFLRDLLTGTTSLISRRAGGGNANSSSHHAVISGDGQYVAFYSHATNLDVTGTNSTSGYSQIYRWQRSTGQIELISVNGSDTDGGVGYSYNP